MPQFLEGVGNIIGNAAPNVHHPEGKAFLDAFLGNRIEKQDESGRFAVNPLTGDVELESPGGFKLTANPVQRSVQGQFKFGGADPSIRQSEVLPEVTVDNPLDQVSPAKRELETMLYDYKKNNPDWWRP